MPYGFGFPDVLVKIHFPHSGNQDQSSESLPWFWWITPQRPFYFQYIGTQVGGHGWQRTQNAPLIRILPIDKQHLTPTPLLGFKTLENAIDGGAPDSAWGRFEFADKFFWKVMGEIKPEFTVVQGRPTQIGKTKKPPIGGVIRQVTQRWRKWWNDGAKSFNENAQLAVNQSGGGDAFYPFPSTEFAVPLPVSTNVSELAAQEAAQAFYLGPVPGGFWFEQGAVAIFKQAYSFNVNVGQLPINKWRFDVFPPKRTGFVGSVFAQGGFETNDCSAYGQTSFPLAGPQIIGGGL